MLIIIPLNVFRYRLLKLPCAIPQIFRFNIFVIKNTPVLNTKHIMVIMVDLDRWIENVHLCVVFFVCVCVLPKTRRQSCSVVPLLWGMGWLAHSVLIIERWPGSWRLPK